MKAHDFLRALNYLGDDTIEEADRMRQSPKKRHTWAKYVSLAACAAAVIAAGAVFINQPKIEREPSETTFPTALEDIFREPLDFDEEPIDGLDYVLDDDLLPVYTNEATPTPSASDGLGYGELMNAVSVRLRLLEYRIIEPLEPEEAQEIYPENKEIQSGNFTVYRAEAVYDYVADRAVDFEFYISQAGGHLSPTEGMPEYEPGKRLLSAVIFEDQACASAVEELRFAISELGGKNICYHIGSGSVRFVPTVRTPECPNIDLEFADGEASRVTTEAKNLEIYTQKSTLESLVSFLISDWQQRGIIAKTRETRLDGSLYTLEFSSEPSGDKVNLIKNSATGEPTGYQMILEEYLGKDTKVYLCEILDILGDSDGGSTLYRAKADYDILSDEEISMEFDIAHAGNSEAQIEGCPGYRKGGKYLLFFNNFDKFRENTALPELEFELFEVMGERIMYHILGDNIRLIGDYPNLDLEMSEGEKSVVTTTAANPVRYTQKSTFESLCAFIRDSFSEVGYLEKTDNDIKLLNPPTGASDVSENESQNPNPGAEQIDPAKYFLGKGEIYTPEQVEKIFPNRGTPCLNLSLDGEIPLFKKRLKSPGEADISLMKKKIMEIFDDLDISSPELSEVSECLVTGYAGGFRVTGDASDGVYKYTVELDEPLDFPEYFDIPYESDDPFEPGFIRRDVGFRADSTVDEIMAAGMFLSEKFPWLFENGSETFAGAYGYPPEFIEKNLAVTVVSGFGGLKTFYRYFYAGAVFEGDGEGRLARIIIRDFENSYEPDRTAEVLHWGDEEALIRAGEGYPASEDAVEPGNVLYSELVYEADGKAYFKVYCEGGVYYVKGYDYGE